MEQIARHLDAPFDSKGMFEFHTATIDKVLAAQTAVISARSLGIDSLIRQFFQAKNTDAIYKRFHLPRHLCYPILVVLLGYAKEEPAFQKGRLSGEGIVHRNVYTPFDAEALDRIVARYDVKEDHMGYISDWEEKGYEHYLEWFCHEWNNGGSMEDASCQIMKTLEEIGVFHRNMLS